MPALSEKPIRPIPAPTTADKSVSGSSARSLRKAVFWLHLILGVVAGAVILSMSVSGMLIAYERQILEWADREFQSPPPSAEAVRLPLETLTATLREARPDFTPTAINWKNDPAAPVVFQAGKETQVFMNPWTGAVLDTGDRRLREFFHSVTEWHRWLGQEGKGRDIGKAITGTASLCFFGLLVSGIYLWIPRVWRGSAVRAVTLFNPKLKGRARDWNWHNVTGFWLMLPILLVTLTGILIAWPWATNLLFTLTGSEPPPPRQERRAGGGEGPKRSVNVTGLNALAVRAEQHRAGWKTLSVNLSGKPDAPLAFTVLESHRGRPDLRTVLNLDRATAQPVSEETFAGFNTGRKLRTWARWVHTGEAGGVWGQTLALVSAAGTALLVWTGFALTWRRFKDRKGKSTAAAR